MKTRTPRPSFSCSLALASLLLGGIAGCATETGGGGSATGASAATSSGTASGTSSNPCVTTLASSQFGWGPLALQGDRVSWAILNSGAMMSVPLGGGAPTMLAPNDGLVFAMAADATDVYWAQPSGVMKVAATGGPVTQLAPLTSSERVSQIAVDADSVYWLQFPISVAAEPNATTVPGSLRKAPLAGGASTEIASFGVTNITGYFTLDAASVYWSDTVHGTIMKAPKGGGTPVTLATGQELPQSLTVDADSVYWVSWAVNAHKPPWLAKVAKTGGAPVTLASSDGEGLGQIAVDATGVYSLGGQSARTRLLHVPLEGGPTEVLAEYSDMGGVALIACPGGVCWTSSTDALFPATVAEMGYVMRWQACQ